MAIILGVDAAWTERGSSGVALLSSHLGVSKVLSVASSYETFIATAAQRGAISRHKPKSGTPKVSDLLKAARSIANANVDVVAIDMPISKKPILGRRAADDAISEAFGAAWAGTHSPTKDRPGHHGRLLTAGFNRAGFSIATADSWSKPSLVEVYPLAALVRLMRKRKRPGYKVSKTLTYWPGRSISDRSKLLLNSWHKIVVALQGEVGDFGFEPPKSFTSFASLKPYEDMLDATICCWMGACFFEGAAEPFGDSDAAIWIPRAG
jgi:predicted RNase H-like nuclease